MRRISAAIIGFAVCATAVIAAPPALATEGLPGLATGGVNYINAGGTPVHLSFVAQAPGTGQVEYIGSGGVRFHGIVDCYQQTANGAQFSGFITSSNSGQFSFFRGSVVDNGEPSTGDLVRFGFRPAQTPYDCHRPYAALRPVVSGNVQVHSDPSALTSTAVSPGSDQYYPGEQE
jgi:hypothetical protein